MQPMLKLHQCVSVRWGGGVSVQTIPAACSPNDEVRDFRGALAYDAPFLIEKLNKDQIVDSAAEGEMLFTEVKRYLVLTRLDPHISWQMYSTRVDEVWHQFVLFTHEYRELLRSAPRRVRPPSSRQRTGIALGSPVRRVDIPVVCCAVPGSIRAGTSRVLEGRTEYHARSSTHQ